MKPQQSNEIGFGERTSTLRNNRPSKTLCVGVKEREKFLEWFSVVFMCGKEGKM